MERIAANGSVTLQPWAEPTSTFGSWVSDAEVSVDYFAFGEHKIVLGEGDSMFTYVETLGRDDGRSSARLWIDVEAGTYSVAFAPNAIPVERTTWAEFPPEVREDMEALCLSEYAATFFLACWALEEAEPRTEDGTASVVSGSVSYLPLPASGLTLSGSETIGDTSFTWSLRPAGTGERTLAITEVEPLGVDW
jgi:hypothetical protein